MKILVVFRQLPQRHTQHKRPTTVQQTSFSPTVPPTLRSQSPEGQSLSCPSHRQASRNQRPLRCTSLGLLCVHLACAAAPPSPPCEANPNPPSLPTPNSRAAAIAAVPLFATTSTVGDLIRHPALQPYARQLLPWDGRAYEEQLPLAKIASLMPYHTAVEPQQTVHALNYLLAEERAGRQVHYPIYSKLDQERDPSMQHTGLFFLRGRPGAPFAVLAPGGGFQYVGSLHEGFPHAQAIADAGYNAFVLKYRAGLGERTATEDLAAALSFIQRNADRLGVAREGYSLWGSSAGARMVASVGSHGAERFGGDPLPAPATVVVAYSAHSDYSTREPPTFVVVGEDDGIAPPSSMAPRVAALHSLGTPVVFHRYPHVAHGFGTGEGTQAAGWVQTALQFWQQHTGQALSPQALESPRPPSSGSTFLAPRVVPQKAVRWWANPLGLAYRGAITHNAPGQVHLHRVQYQRNGLTLSANVYTPPNFDPQSLHPVVVVAHPNGGVKEQVAGLYAQRLAERGYLTIAADAAYQGASRGTPRNVDKPSNRIEDIRSMADYIAQYPGADRSRLGLLGICGGGGYALKTAQTDKRFGAVATLSLFNTGRVRRQGYLDSQRDTVHQRLNNAARAREREAAGGPVAYAANDSWTDEEIAQLPFELYRQGFEYYGKTHQHPGSSFRYTKSSLLELMAFDATDQLQLLDQPLLLLAGSRADSFYMTEEAFAKATGTPNKQLVRLEGASHIETYWVPEHVRVAVTHLTHFFERWLSQDRPLAREENP